VKSGIAIFVIKIFLQVENVNIYFLRFITKTTEKGEGRPFFSRDPPSHPERKERTAGLGGGGPENKCRGAASFCCTKYPAATWNFRKPENSSVSSINSTVQTFLFEQKI
jgi:hypothetical protein